jgi:hypothetical protein
MDVTNILNWIIIGMMTIIAVTVAVMIWLCVHLGCCEKDTVTHPVPEICKSLVGSLEEF